MAASGESSESSESVESAEGSPDILSRSPDEGARRIALGYLDQAAAAVPRLAGAGHGDDEALHDLRVALRRLRSCLGSYARQLGESVPKKLARCLRRLARATGPGRDAEVQIAWLRQQGRSLGSRHRPGLRWLLARLEQRRDEAYAALSEEVARDFAPVEEGLRRRLSVYRAKVRLDENHPPSFAGAAADLLHRHAARLARRLARVADAGDVERAHQARISAKRLRYLADPLAKLVEKEEEEKRGEGGARAAQLVRRLKGLQDLLGELHDAHVLEAELAAALEDAASERARRLLELTLAGEEADPRRLRAERQRPREPGLLALARLNRARRDRLFEQFGGRWQGERGEQLLLAAEELEDALRAAAREGPAGAEAGAAEAAAPAAPEDDRREAAGDAGGGGQ